MGKVGRHAADDERRKQEPPTRKRKNGGNVRDGEWQSDYMVPEPIVRRKPIQCRSRGSSAASESAAGPGTRKRDENQGDGIPVRAEFRSLVPGDDGAEGRNYDSDDAEPICVLHGI